MDTMDQPPQRHARMSKQSSQLGFENSSKIVMVGEMTARDWEYERDSHGGPGAMKNMSVGESELLRVSGQGKRSR